MSKFNLLFPLVILLVEDAGLFCMQLKALFMSKAVYKEDINI